MAADDYVQQIENKKQLNQANIEIDKVWWNFIDETIGIFIEFIYLIVFCAYFFM